MTPIYLHEYTITLWNKDKMGVQQVVIVVVTDNKDKELFPVEEYLPRITNGNCNISHRILLEGYKQDE